VLAPDLTDRVHDLEVSDVDILSFSIGSTSVVWGTSERPEVKAEIVRALLRKSPDVIDVSAPDTPVTR
jgi:cell division protein FtsQ